MTAMRRLLGALVFAMLAGAAPDALAQGWPQKPVHIVVPFPPGGVTDSIARITSEWLTNRLGQPVIAENRPGASGAIAGELVARSAPDGYTLLLATVPPLAIAPHVQKVPYDPLKDFAPIAIVGTNPFALAVNHTIPGTTLAEFVEYVKAHPGKLSYGSPGAGTVGHLTMALFLERSGLKMEAVPYKGGGPAMADVIAGHVPAYFGNLNDILPHAKGGKIKVLAVSSAQRTPQLLDVPTVAEQGYPGFRTVTWNGLAAPAHTPPAIIDRLAHEIELGCRDAAFAARLNGIGVDPVCNSPAEFAQTLHEDFALWKAAVRIAGVKAE